MRTKYPILELIIGALLAVIILLVVCHPKKVQAQGYGVPLKPQYEGQNIQNEFDRLWNFITDLNVSDFGSASFDSANYYDTIYTNFKFDTILYVNITYDTSTTTIGWEQNVAWVSTLSDSSVIIMQHQISVASKYWDYTWQVSGRLKKP